jgi:hypothetical protein
VSSRACLDAVEALMMRKEIIDIYFLKLTMMALLK